MADFFSVYNFIFGLCFLAWTYFDTVSIIALSAHKLTEEEMIAPPKLGGHLILKFCFYLFTIIGMFFLSLNAIICGAIGFFIGVKMARDSGLTEHLIYFKNPEDFTALIKYCNIMFISGMVFFAMVIFL